MVAGREMMDCCNAGVGYRLYIITDNVPNALIWIVREKLPMDNNRVLKQDMQQVR